MRRPLRKQVLYVDDDVALARLVAGFLADELESESREARSSTP